MNKKVTIIIPTYNSEKTILQCIRSVISQTYKNLEILIIDDGSVDQTLDLIKKNYDPRIKILQQSHGGVGVARNLGIKKSLGDYVMFLDSDDDLEFDAVSTLLNFAENEKANVIKFNFNFVKDGIKTKSIFSLAGKKVNSRKDHELLVRHFFEDEHYVPSLAQTLFIKKKFLIDNDLYFHNDLYMMEDAVFHLELFDLDADIFFLDATIYNYNVNPYSITHSNENAFRAFTETLKTSHIILSKIGYKGAVAEKYFKMATKYAFKCTSRYKIDKLFFRKDMVRIAYAADVGKDKVYWRYLRFAIINKRCLLLRFLIWIYKNRVRLWREK